ncbi:MAG: M3 family metallopeptidase [Gammaproteobacteria bacterium]|nr:M3 family metallopeptidase [Gammaproteobacteria bacterium]
MENPLLNQGSLPVFSTIIPEKHIEPALKQVITENRAALTKLLDSNVAFTWDNLMAPMEEMSDKLGKVWSPVSHMHSVVESEILRDVYNTCLPLLTEYHTEIMQNETLFKAIKSIADGPEYQKLNAAQRKVIDNDIRDFKLSGVSLPPADKARFADILKEMSKLTTLFSEHLLDATHAFTLHLTDPEATKGLPPETLKMVAQNAEQRDLTGWVLTLDFPCYSAVMKYLENRELRWLMYEAYVTRASDTGPHAGKWDNTQIIEDILRLRHELANLMGFANYAEYSLATKMADSPKRVLAFLSDLIDTSKEAAKAEMAELRAFAKSRDQLDQIENWDIPFYTEKLREAKYAISQEELKPYFPAQKVLDGMFVTVNRLYGIHIAEKKDVDTWHPQVKYFEIFDQNHAFIGGFYTDLYARPHKRDGAWMDEARTRRILPNDQIQFPVAYLTCNFTPPIDNKPALLSQDEVETVFHEFGHCLHHLLTRVDYAAVSGINGVPWDAVEFPSQIMEHWCWDKKTIELISSHYETHEPLPELLYNKMQAAKNFQSGMQMLRQVEFSLFDFRIHLEYDPKLGGRVQPILDEIRAKVAVVPYPTFNRFQNSFSHIFAGGYAAGYYSYKWAEVLSSDAFSLFEETGTFNPKTGLSFLENILQKGGVRDPMLGFVAFRGREPRIDALLRHSGLTAEKM